MGDGHTRNRPWLAGEYAASTGLGMIFGFDEALKHSKYQ